MKSMRGFVRELILERDANPPETDDTLRHGLFYKLIPRIERWAQEQGIDIEKYDETHKQNFGVAVYKTMSSVLSQMVLNGETSYEHLRIIETERQRDEAVEPDFNVEVWFEKNGLMQIFKPIKTGLNISLWASKGYQSTNVLEQMVRRLQIHPVKTVLLWSDFDPSGLSLADDIKRRALRLGIRTKFIRIGVNPDQIPSERRTLSLIRLKKKDSRYKKFVQEHGTRAYEVTALGDEELRKETLDALERLGLDFEHSVQERLKDDQAWQIRQITERVLLTLKRSVRQSVAEKVVSRDTRQPTKQQLVDSILKTTQFLSDIPSTTIQMVVQEVKDQFGITEEDDE